jgi:hypothetical protein
MKLCLQRLRLIEEEIDERLLMPGSLLLAPPQIPKGPDPPARKIPLAALKPLKDLPFQLRYLVEGLVSHSILHPPQVEPAIEELHARYGKGDRMDVKNAVILLESLFCLERIDDIGKVFESELPACFTREPLC